MNRRIAFSNSQGRKTLVVCFFNSVDTFCEACREVGVTGLVLLPPLTLAISKNEVRGNVKEIHQHPGEITSIGAGNVLE